MKITSFHPMIATKNPEALVKLFEGLGFEKRHEKTNLDGIITSYVRMKDKEGRYVDVGAATAFERDFTCISVNVDDFEEGLALLTNRGFTMMRADDHVETPSSVAAILVAPSGFAIGLTKHIKG